MYINQNKNSSYNLRYKATTCKKYICIKNHDLIYYKTFKKTAMYLCVCVFKVKLK